MSPTQLFTSVDLSVSLDGKYQPKYGVDQGHGK